MSPVYGNDSSSKWEKNGQVGERFIDTGSTYFIKDKTTPRDTTLKTTMTSPYFQIRRDTLHFLIGGGSQPNNYVALIVDGQEKRTASGGKQISQANLKYGMGRRWWDVTEFKGKCAKLKIIDIGDTADTWDYTSYDDLRASAPAFQGKLSFMPQW